MWCGWYDSCRSVLVTRHVATVWVNCFVTIRCGWNDVLPFDNLPVELASRYHLIPTHFLNSAIMEGHDSMHLFPVSPSSISLRPCHWTCILSCGCVGLSVRRYCCGFWYDVMDNGYRILNCIMNLSFLIFGFYLSLGIPQFLFKFILLHLFCLLIPIWYWFVSVVIVIGFCLSEWYNRLCESWAGVRWHN